jgi:tRNA modification GTPase
MFSTDDTIVAIATPPGRGGIGIVRISGPAAAAIAGTLTSQRSFEPRHATLTTVFATDGNAIDQVIVTRFPAPHSYTGEEIVEVSAHGSPVVLEAIVSASIARGARLANPGEFTLRAYLHGRMDLVQAEAVAELIDAVTPLQARVAFDQLEGTLTTRLRAMDATLLDLIARLEASVDFPDEGYHFITPGDLGAELERILQDLAALLADASSGRMIREGLTAAIVGRPNAGKSSLFNRLAGGDRAIVTVVPGTTRDLLTERVDIEGIPFTMIDTAGLRGGAGDPIEEEGMARARQAAAAADLLILVLDRSQPLTDEDRALLESSRERRGIIVASKSDLPPAWDAAEMAAQAVSSVIPHGVDALRKALVDAAGVRTLRDRAPIANIRQAALLHAAHTAIERARRAAADGGPEELVLADLHDARGRFDDIAGVRPQDEVLRVIFERFCIGK